MENSRYEMSHHILHLLRDNPAIEADLLYPYLCLCEWVLHDSHFEETLTKSLTISPVKTYEIFNIPAAQGESAEQMIARLGAIENSQFTIDN